jgi:hypothetical protein
MKNVGGTSFEDKKDGNKFSWNVINILAVHYEEKRG